VIVKEAVNKSNHPIQNPLILVTEPQTSDILVSEFVTILIFVMEMQRVFCEIGAGFFNTVYMNCRLLRNVDHRREGGKVTHVLARVEGGDFRPVDLGLTRLPTPLPVAR
jgi:hypothetical protein